MSAELLREAANLMRERAQAASLHPKHRLAWMTDGDAETFVLAPKDVGGWDGIVVADCHEADDAAHIASWHPAVALAVADLLEVVAATSAPNRAGFGEAVTVARAYLGRDS